MKIFIPKYAERNWNEIENALNQSLTGLNSIQQGFEIYFAWYCRLKALNPPAKRLYGFSLETKRRFFQKYFHFYSKLIQSINIRVNPIFKAIFQIWFISIKLENLPVLTKTFSYLSATCLVSIERLRIKRTYDIAIFNTS